MVGCEMRRTVLTWGLLALPVLVVVAAMGIGCGSGLSQSDAESRCNAEQAAKMYLFGPGVYSMCVSCYERCGNDCTPQGTAPATYLCPGDAPIDGGSE
jgi:hypothetical protein